MRLEGNIRYWIGDFFFVYIVWVSWSGNLEKKCSISHIIILEKGNQYLVQN